ncbi:MAG TPA: type II toxin-antitoxin system RelE/ParE family toxin [Chloroflexota bacterium]|nr:type II toxin-antitoxin system RelE/ParE family toxin [Chloroflexota bacterium]
MIIWSSRARRDLARLDPEAAARVDRTVHHDDDTGQGDLKKLAGVDAAWRLRVRDWRILFTFTDDPKAILVLRVLNRRDAYR